MSLKSMVLITLAMLYGLADLMYAAPPATPLATVYSWESNGSQYISGVSVMATLVTPIDSTGIPFNSVSSVIYSTTTPVDSAQSGSDGKWAIRLPVTANISPTGSKWHLVATYRGRTRWEANVSLADTTTICIQKATGQTATCP